MDVNAWQGQSRRRHSWTALAVATAGWMAWAVPLCASAQPEPASPCGSVFNQGAGNGPYDYYTDRKFVAQIEGNHFQPQVEALVGGVSGPIGAELDFVLRSVPNHPKVLLTLIRYGEKLKWVRAPGLRFSYECYFDRALRFRPNDALVRMIYATYLNKLSRTPEALHQLAYAADLAKEDGFAQYNVGLIYFEMRHYDLALIQAHKALALSFPKTALRDSLKSVGKWKEPEPTPGDALPSELGESAPSR